MTEQTPKFAAGAAPGRPALKRQSLYVNVADPGDPDLLFENAETVADSHGPLPLLDYLYDFAREPKLPREAWTRKALVSSCLEYLMEDFFYHTPSSSMTRMFDPEGLDDAVRALTSPRGLVALAFHGGFGVNLIHFLAAFVDESLIIAPKARPQFRSLSAKDPATTLFETLRALREGRTVCIAPDGEVGRPQGTIQLLGADCAVNDGAAFLAYETGCDTAWSAMLRRGRLFAPIVVPGPSRAPGESYKGFRTRLMEFYRERIEAHFTGPPENVAISKAWRRRLKAAMVRQAALRGSV